MRTAGRRNSLGMPLNIRTCEWQSGTHPAFAVYLRSNTHTGPNYRLPFDKSVHDDEFCKLDCTTEGDTTRTAKQAQRAQRQATNYFCGYTCKRQPVGRYELKATAQSMNMVHAGLQDRRVGQQWHRVTNRLINEYYQRSMLRTAPEIFNLAANATPEDMRAAEFVRTYTSEIRGEKTGGSL